MKTTIRFLIRIVAGAVLLLVTFILTALALSYISTSPKAYICTSSNEVYLSTNGVHVDIILPKTQLDSSLVQELAIPGHISYVAFGWGDQGFYLETPTWDDLKASTALKALFLRSKSTMHVSHYKNAYSSWKKVSICPEQNAKLLAFFKDTFKQDEQNQFQKIGDKGYTASDFFYEAKGSYSIFKTCNVWVNQALKQAEIKTAVYTPFDFGILRHLDE